MSGANDAPRQLIVLGDSGVHGWGDREAGGWCQRLRLRWMNLPSAPVAVSYTHLTLPTILLV